MRMLIMMITILLLISVNLVGYGREAVYTAVDSVKYPPLVTTAKEKSAYVERLEELLRLEYNKKRQEVKDGKLKKAAFDKWVEEFRNPRKLLISRDRWVLRKALKESTQYSPDIENDFNEKVQ